MLLLQLNHSQMQEVKARFGGKYLVVECQPYGQEYDFLYHILCHNQTATSIVIKGLGRKIEDTGRTVGMWQCLGGSGIYRKDLIQLATFIRPEIRYIFDSIHTANIKTMVKGSTWKEIFDNTIGLPVAMKRAVELV